MRIPLLSAAMAMSLLAAGCAGPRVPIERLQPRAAEAVDPRIAVERAVIVGAPAPGLSARIAALVGEAEAATGQFERLAATARAAASRSGPAQSESWILAQLALSQAVAARAPVTRALGDLDGLIGRELEAKHGIAEGDRQAILSGTERVAAIDRAQAATIAAIRTSLAR